MSRNTRITDEAQRRWRSNNPDFNPIEFDGIKERIIPSALTQKEESQQTTCLEGKL